MAGMARAGFQKAQTITYLLGRCMPCSKTKSARIRVKHLVMDENLTMYFPSYQFLFAYDPNQTCKVGDTVLIRSLPEKMTTLLTHEVVKVVYPLGDVTDPITGKKVVVSKFREDVKAINKMYGESPQAFNYDEAPERTNKSKRDFTHKSGIQVFHNDPKTIPPHAI